MTEENELQTELDDYEAQLGEIAEILLSGRLTTLQKLEEIEAIVFPDEEDDE